MKEKGDPCILVGYSTQSKGYRVYNKRTRLIVESIHIKFNEIKEMTETYVGNDTSGLVTQREKASNYDNFGLAPQLQNVSPSTDTTDPLQQELDLLFSPLYDKKFQCRPDIVQAVCYCALHQARPTKKHLKEVKRIFRYLRGTINMRLWYPKDSDFELTAFLDVDHVGCLDTHKSTSGGIQFLGYAQVMWMRIQLKDYGFNYNKILLYCDY
nr:hypothetical protein [Tanacetum cinerariifolium]